MALPGSSLAPLRRKPKRLREVPTVYSSGGTPLVLDLAGYRGDGDLDEAVGGQGVLITTQHAAVRDLAELVEEREPDPAIAAMARRIAQNLAVRRRTLGPRPDRGAGTLVSVPYRYRSDDIDLDRTIEVLTERPVPEDTDIIVRERMRSRRAVVLIVDVSGSMRGEKVRVAAATVAALARDLVDDELAVVAFWSDAAVVAPLASGLSGPVVLDSLLRIPARGLTNVGFGLSAARAELAGALARRRTAILLSDCVHNAGPDPRDIARRFGELHVLLQTDGEHDTPLAADMARLGHGRLLRVATHRDVAPALNRVLGASARS